MQTKTVGIEAAEVFFLTSPIGQMLRIQMKTKD